MESKIMKKKGTLAIAVIFLGAMFAFSSCDQNVSTEFEESFEVVNKVTPISEAQNTTMELQRGNDQDSFFIVSFSNIKPNNLINDGIKEGWCIEWNDDATFGIQNGTKLYSTKGQKSWERINYFLSIKNQLKAEDPDLTFRELQVVIWSLIENPKFELDKISEYENISERIYKDGEPLFNVQKVKDIVNRINNDLSSPNKLKEIETSTVHAVIVENDGQTIIVEGDETLWAFGTEYCFRSDDGQQWGWVYGFHHEGNTNFSDSTSLVAGAGQSVCPDEKVEDTGGTIVGDLIVKKTGDTLEITYKASGNNVLSEVHLDADCDLETLKSRIINKGGNVPPGKLPLKYSEDNFFTEVTFTISISENSLDCSNSIFIAAHGVVHTLVQ